MLITKTFANFVHSTNYDDLPKDAIESAKERILDTIGSMLAGYCGWDYKEQFLNACRELDSGDCSILCDEKKEFSIARASMIDSTFAHAIELDDGHKNAGVHAGAVVIPTALNMGRMLGASGKDIITAIVLGYEIVYRIASSMSPYQIQKGFHPSGNCDTFGAMTVAGKLMGLSEEELANGLGMAGLYAAGLMEATVSGQQSKCIQVGNAAFNGITAAYMAKNGLEGTTTVFEGKTGFFKAQSENVDLEKVVFGLGESYSIGDTYTKLYPTCRHSQPAIEAVIDAIQENGFKYEEVEKISVNTHQVAYDLTGKIIHPKNSGEAKFSLAYGVALALTEQSVGVAHLMEEYTENSINKELSSLVEVNVDPEVQALYPGRRGAIVTICLKDGKKIVRECFDLKGSPNNPVGFGEIKQKFVSNAKSMLTKKSIDKIIDKINNLEKEQKLDDVLTLLIP
jgi:2-methylcitrate dehydratase PrpD